MEGLLKGRKGSGVRRRVKDNAGGILTLLVLNYFLCTELGGGVSWAFTFIM